MAKEIISECEYCGYKTREKESKCPLCGASLKTIERVVADTFASASYNTADTYSDSPSNTQSSTNTTTHTTRRTTYVPRNSRKNKLTAALLAFFAGNLGLHQFYVGNTLSGILYICFWWTSIPSILSIIDGIRYLCMTDDKFYAMTNK